MDDNDERGERSPGDEELTVTSEAEETISVAGALRTQPRFATQPPVIPGYRIVGLLGEGGWVRCGRRSRTGLTAGWLSR